MVMVSKKKEGGVKQRKKISNEEEREGTKDANK